MYTVCPKCTLTLAVTANDLRTGQGYVRCGRCSNVFNALLTLSEQPPELFGHTARAPQSGEVVSSAQVEQILLSGNAPPGAAKTQGAPPKATHADGGVTAGSGTGNAAANPSTPADRRALLARHAMTHAQSRLATSTARSQPGPAVRIPLGPAAAASSAGAGTRPAATTAAAPAAAAAANASATSAAVTGGASMASPYVATGPQGEEGSIASDDVTGQFELPRRGGRPSPQPTPPPQSRTPPQDALRPAQPLRPRGPATDAAPAPDETVLESAADEADDARMCETIVLEGEGFTTQTAEYVSEEQAELAALKREIASLDDESPSGSVGASVRTGTTAVPARGNARAGVGARAASADGAHSAHQAAPPHAAGARWQTSVMDSEAEDVQVAVLPQEAADDAAALQFSPRRPRSEQRAWAWLWGAVALTVLLAAQAVNHWRDALAASPSLGGLVTGTYAKLGVALEPHWDLSAYEVRQQGAEADPKDMHVIHVRLSLANHANRAQPVPMLRLTLLDRYGKRLARRDLPPSEYWPAGRPRQEFIRSDERIDSVVAVRDPHADSASFELDVCLNEHEQLRCAGDVAPVAAAPLSP